MVACQSARPEGLLPVDAGAQRGEFMIEKRLIDPLKRLSWWLNGPGVAEMRESQTRPGPIHRMFDQSRADRITEYIAENGEEMAVLLNRKTFESALPHMPMTAVMLVVTLVLVGCLLLNL